MPNEAQVAVLAGVTADLIDDASTDLYAALAGLDPGDMAGWRDEALVVVPDLVATYGDAVTGFAADTYDEWRDEARVAGLYRAVPADVATLDQIAAGVRVAAGSLLGADPDMDAAMMRLDGSLSRYLTLGAGDTMADNAVRDPKAAGWRRVAKPTACRFCRMLAGRGAVYREKTVRFTAHDHCQCQAAPSWDWDSPRPIDVAYRASKRVQTDEDRARVREYLADMAA